jgi:nitrite reductase (NADH) small subunit
LLRPGDREFVTVARVGDIPSGQGRQVTIEDRWVGLFNLNGQYHAVDNVCLHRGGPLSDGPITGCIVTCPWHGWQYDVTTGMLVQDPAVGVTRHETRVAGDEVQVRLTE